MILHGAIPSVIDLLLSMEQPSLDPFLCAHEDSRAPSTEDSIPASPQSGSGSGSTCVELPPDKEGGTSETNGPPESPPVEIQGGGDKRATREDPADSPTDSSPDSWKKRYQNLAELPVDYSQFRFSVNYESVRSDSFVRTGFFRDICKA
jgi:hypothetical protein